MLHRLFLLTLLLAAIAGPARADESIPPFVAGFERFARHADIDAQLAGQLLLGELSCTACHAGEPVPKRGPRLNGAGNRLQPDWMRAFVLAPRTTKPGTTMPDVLRSLPADERERAADALVAFLATQTEPFPELKAGGANPLPHEFWNKGDATRGRELYHRVGCVACHAPDPTFDGGHTKPSALDALLAQLDPEDIAELGLNAAARPVPSVPHGDLAAKYTPQSLTHFLLDPETIRPAGRMPNLKLTPVEAADLAAYLLRDQPASTADPPDRSNPNAALVAEGRRRFVELSCANCHTAKGVTPTTTARPLAELRFDAERTCLNGPTRGLPHYPLDELQSRAIGAALEPAPNGLVAATSPVDLTLLQSNCYACHERAGKGGVGRNRQRYFATAGDVDLGDEGRLPPPLDHVGRKLEPAWLSKVLAGTGDVRPHLLARMPRFPKAAVALLPVDLARADLARDHLTKPPTETEVFGKLDGLAEAGRQLLDTGCVQCHPLRGETLPGTVGVDLVGLRQRVRPEWFRDFLRDPATLKSRTRMPTFFPNGTSANQDLLEGDVDRQIAAMWAYLVDVEKQPLPDTVVAARTRDFELIPDDRPLVLRTFSKEAGTRTIAVGFPQGVHLFFDAEHVRPAIVWRGRFLDAYGTWFDRFAPPAGPLGKDRIAFPNAPSFVGEGEGESRFRGYRVDETGVPTFLYRVGALDVEDRFEPHGERGLRRSLSVTSTERNAGPLWFVAHAGENLKHPEPETAVDSAGLAVTLTRGDARRATLETTDGVDRWRVRLESGQRLIVEYRW